MDVKLRNKPGLLRWLRFRRALGIAASKAFLWCIIVLMALLMALQYPIVQTRLGNEAAKKLSEEFGYPISISKLHLAWFDKLSFKGVAVKDTEGNGMISIDEIIVDYQFHRLLTNNTFLLESVTLHQPDINLIQKNGKFNINHFIDAIIGIPEISIDTIDQQPSEIEKGKGVFQVNQVRIYQGHYSQQQLEKGDVAATDSLHFNPLFFGFKDINADISFYRMVGDTLEIGVKKLSAIEERINLPIHELHTFFRLTNHSMQFHPLYARVGNSTLRESLSFYFDSIASFKNFNTDVSVKAQLTESKIDFADVERFAPGLPLKKRITASGRVEGEVSNFDLEHINVAFGKGSHLMGDISLEGLPDLNETFMVIDLTNSTLLSQDLKGLNIPEQYLDIADRFEEVFFDVNIVGLPYDFVADGKFKSNVGSFVTDMNIKTESMAYEGVLQTENLHLGKISGNDSILGRIDMDGTISGKGLSLADADFNLNAKISRFELLGYPYHHIETKGHFKKEQFNGHLAIQDTNFTVELEGNVNFADSAFDFSLNIDTANLHELNLTHDKSSIRSQIEAKFTGLTPDEIKGNIILANTYLEHEHRQLYIDSVLFSTEKTYDAYGVHRNIEMDCDLFSINAKGTYKVKQFYQDLLRLHHEYNLSIGNDSVALAAYYDAKIDSSKAPYRLDFTLELRDINRIIELFDDDIHVAHNTLVKGEIDGGNFFSVELYALSDSLQYADYRLDSDTLILFTSKHEHEHDFDFEAIFRSRQQSFLGIVTNELFAEIYRHEDVFHFDSHINHKETNDHLNLAGHYDIYMNYHEVNLTNTTFNIIDDLWENSGLNKIIIHKDGTIEIADLSFTSGSEKLRIDGKHHKDGEKFFEILVENLNLNLLSGYLGKEVQGIGNFEGRYESKNDKPKLASELSFDSVTVAGFNIGDLYTNTSWDVADNRIALEGGIIRSKQEVLNINGHFSMLQDTLPHIDVKVLLQGANLNIAEPFINEYVSDLDGLMLGYISISGDPREPTAKGDILINEGQFRVEYLNTLYRFSDKIYITPKFIGVKGLNLEDENGSVCMLDGGINHDRFKGIDVNLTGEMDDFLVYDTYEDDSVSFYGRAIGSGDMAIRGPFTDLEVEVNATTEKGTRVFIPLDNYQGLEDQDYIKFVQNEDSLLISQLDSSLKLQGVKLDFNLDITPDAYCEVILDRVTGDRIQGKGKGKIKMAIDTKGEFAMYGGVEIVQGSYTFTMLNILSKEFKIAPNSKISWTGDPYLANLDIQANYRQYASLSPLINTTDSAVLSSAEVRKRYPVEVLLNLKGSMDAPEITFGISIEEYPSMIFPAGVPVSLESYVAAFKQRLKNDEQELNKQVFSLIMLKKFSPESALPSVNESAAGSVSELLSNQLSYWVSQVDNNLEIDLDVNGLDRSALNDMQLRLSYTMLDGRLKVTRDGAVSNSNNNPSQTSEANSNAAAIGDWTVEYTLSADGRWRAKIFHKQNHKALSTALNNNTTSGLSIMHTKSFDTFRELWMGKRYKAWLKKKEMKAKAEKNEKKGNFEDDANKDDPSHGTK